MASIDAGADYCRFSSCSFRLFFWGGILALFFRKTLRAPKDTEELAEGWRRCTTSRLWRDSAALEAWSEKGSVKNSPDVRKKAFRAVLLLGEPSYRETLQLLQPLGVVTETRALPQRQIDAPPHSCMARTEK